MYFYNLHLPDEVRVFGVPEESILRHDATALVFEVLVGDGLRLRHYSFPDRWYEVNVSLDLVGDFVEEAHPALPWTFNCDVSTPHIEDGSHIYNVDLELDVLVHRDGRRWLTVDQDAFRSAVCRGLFGPETAKEGEAGLSELVALVRSGQFLTFLVSVYPFGGSATKTMPTAFAPPMRRMRRQDVPRLREWRL